MSWSFVLIGVLNFNGNAFNDGFIYISFQCESYNSGAILWLYCYSCSIGVVVVSYLYSHALTFFFAALLGHYHLYNFPADVFYACAHAY